jgi:hypothetical protein
MGEFDTRSIKQAKKKRLDQQQKFPTLANLRREKKRMKISSEEMDRRDLQARQLSAAKRYLWKPFYGYCSKKARPLNQLD